MSKYTRLTTTQGLQVGDTIYMATHSGKRPMIILKINHENNTVAAVFKEIYDKRGNFPTYEDFLNLFGDSNMTITHFYSKHIPKPRARPTAPVQPKPEIKDDTSRTPDMYEFD
jgi:hypothetical protein